jgi:hypothetical protein
MDCRIAGSPSFIDDVRESLEAEGVPTAVRNRDTAALFDWLVSMVIGLVVLIVVWIFHDTWSYLRLEIRSAFWWMFP